MRRARIPVTPAWGVSLALGTAVISGVSVWLNAFAVKTISDPAVYTTLKNLVAALILITAAAAMGGAAEARTLTRAQWRRLLIIGVIGGSIPFLLFFSGLALATAPSAAFIHKTLFIWVALMAVPLLGERLGGLQIGALGVLLIGQVLLVAPAAGGAVGLGELMILAATVLWSAEVIVAKRALVGISPAVVGAARLGFGAILLVGYVLATGGAAVLATLSAEALWWVLLTGIVLAAYVGTWLGALRRAPATVVTAVLVVGAVITAGLNVVSSGVVPGGQALVGLFVMMVAALVLAWSARRSVAPGAGADPPGARTSSAPGFRMGR